MLIIENVTLETFKPLSTILNFTKEMSYNERVTKRHEYISNKLKENPKYEGWDYIEYWEIGEEEKLVTSKTAMISSRGALMKEKGKEKKILHTRGSISGFYLRASFKDIDNITHKTYIHRLVASTFVPRDEKFENIHFGKLIANHNGLIKTNNNFNNLNWMTQSGNVKHAILNGNGSSTLGWGNLQERRTLKGVYLVPGNFKDSVVYIAGKAELLSLGFDHTSIYQCARNEIKTAYGFKWEYIDPAEEGTYDTGIPNDLHNQVINDKAKSSVRTKPVKGTIIKEGPFKGQQFVIYGAKRVAELGLVQAHISRLCTKTTNLKSHAKCEWDYIDPELAEEYQRDPTEEQLKFMLSK